MTRVQNRVLPGVRLGSFAALIFAMVTMMLLFLFAGSPAWGVRIKDIVEIEGQRDNFLVGYGLVVGLDGTGDQMAPELLGAFMKRFNIKLAANDIESDNVAAVMVTATLPPNRGQGQRIDVNVSAMGDAENLHGGTLMPAFLRPSTADPNDPLSIYAQAQGSLSTGGFATGTGGSGGSSIVKNHPTTALIPNGGIVEREVKTNFATKAEIALKLRNPDFTTSLRISQMINAEAGEGMAESLDSGTVMVKMPAVDEKNRGKRSKFLAEILGYSVSPDAPARIVYNERTGTVVMGGNVRISTTIITHGNLILEQQGTGIVQQDQTNTTATGPEGSTNVNQTNTLDISQQNLLATEEEHQFKVIDEGVTIGEVAKGLNALGVTPRDIISILQALKACGALQAELVAM